MTTDTYEEKNLLPHHEQLPLCTSRLPYRQGRKLTAVKVYTINEESNHLLIFGVPSLNLRQETKSLCLHFGKLLQFYVSKDHPAEPFTDTYHARYETIQSARIAKRMIDTKNFFGASLHICYAPELETIEETRSKLLKRKNDVIFRLRNIQKEDDMNKVGIEKELKIDYLVNAAQESHNENEPIVNEVPIITLGHSQDNSHEKINMGQQNIIYLNKNKRKHKVTIEKKFKPCTKEKRKKTDMEIGCQNITEVVDCTSVDDEIVSNINDALNYNKFGNEIVRKVDMKPVNRIIFTNNKKS